MTIAEVNQLSYIHAEQVWPIGRFVKEPSAEVEIGLETEPVILVNWHFYNRASERGYDDELWQQIDQVGRVLGGPFNYGRLERGREVNEQIDELNLTVNSVELYMAFNRFDPGGRPNHDFAVARLGEFTTRRSTTQPGVMRAEPVMIGRDGLHARLYDVHNGWLFY